MKLSNKFLVAFLLLSAMPLFSQFSVNNMSFEVGYGYNGAIKPYNKAYNSNFSGMNHFNLGLRYMFSEKIGAKVFYRVDKFVNDPGGSVGITYNTVGTSFVYNLGKELGLTYLTRDQFGIVTHLDGGVSFARVIDTRIIEKVGVIGLGVTPMYNISNKIAVTADLTYNWNLRQHYGFDGGKLHQDKTYESGNFYNFSIGLIYYIGENKYHSDWY